MKIAVIGAGAIGGFLGARLTLAGEDVTFIDRNEAHCAAINERGLRVTLPKGEVIVASAARAVDSIESVEPVDLVILAVKAQVIPKVAPLVPRLFKPETMVMTVQNGIPWWYFEKSGGRWDGARIECIDPGGTIRMHVPPERIIGCVVYPAAEMTGPGEIHVVEGDRFSVGELDGSTSERVTKLSEMLVRAGFKSYVLDDIRSEIWLKLWGNLSFNPISALTHGTLAAIATYEPTKELAAKMMAEAQEVASKLGITFRHTIEKRIAGAAGVGAHKTSMLQDVEAGRRLEIDALIGAVVELARLTETPTPHIDAVYACVRLLDQEISEGLAFPSQRIAEPVLQPT